MYPQAETSGRKWKYYKFAMSQMHCSKVEDEPMNKNAGQDSDLTLIQVDLIQMDDYLLILSHIRNFHKRQKPIQ